MQLEILVRGQKVRWKRDSRHSIWHKRDDEQMGNIPFYPKSGQSKALRPRAGGDLYRWNWKNHLFEGKNAISVQNHGFLQTSTDSTRINFMYGSRAPWNLGKLPWHTWNNSWCLPWALQAITQSCLSSVVTGGSVKHIADHYKGGRKWHFSRKRSQISQNLIFLLVLHTEEAFLLFWELPHSAVAVRADGLGSWSKQAQQSSVSRRAL